MKKTAERTAAQAYRDNSDRIHKATVRLSIALKAHARRQAADARNWGFAGDLGYVAEVLEEALAFIGGPVRTYRATDREGRPIRVTIPDGR